ncbi:MAG: alpha/beta fold hydrolase [Wenzhouxiangellaceae bacterium]|nr:alpha/beta fold hydrolase [Wenzhouxiangellaceae bacterium]
MSHPVPSDPNAFPAATAALSLSGPAGRLECRVDLPETAQERAATAVICHPHPQHGGTMRNKVVTIIERALRESGLRTIRFNFRGAGDSEGSYADGEGELEDLLAVVEWVRRVRPDDELWLAGFSFGAWISLRAAQQLPVRMLLSIAPPVERYGFTELVAPNCPWLVVQGNEDDVVSPRAVQDWVEGLNPRPDFVMMENCGHFFHRRLMDLRGLIRNAVQPHLP